MTLQWIGIVAALSSAVAWATGAILYKKLGARLTSYGMNLARGGLNLALLFVPFLLVGTGHIDSHTFVLLGISGLLGISLGDTLFFEAVRNAGPHLTVLVSLFGQVLTVFFAVIFLGEYLTTRRIFGIFLTIAGIAIVLYFRITNGEKRDAVRGLFYGLLSVVCMSASVIITKKALFSIDAVQAIFVRILWGTLGLLAWMVITKQVKTSLVPLRDAALMKNFLLMVCITLFGGFWLSHVSLKYIDVSVANTLNSTAPIFVLPLSAFFLNEKITLSASVGTAVTVSGILFLLSAQ